MTGGPRASLSNFIRHKAKRRPLTLEKAAPRIGIARREWAGADSAGLSPSVTTLRQQGQCTRSSNFFALLSMSSRAS